MIPLDRVQVLADGLDHPEGVAWGPDGFVYAGGEAGQIYRISLAGDVEVLGTTGGFCLGLCLDAHANVYVCDQGNRAVMRVAQSGSVTRYADGGSVPMRVPNSLVFDRHGSLYVSDSGDWDQAGGRIYGVRPGGTSRVLADGLAFPNGLALGADGAYLYAALSTEARVVRFPVLASAELGPMEHVLALPGTVPDGLAFDAAGGLLVACYAPDAVYRFLPPSEFGVVVEDPRRTRVATPTNVAFAGEALDLLVIASLSRWHLATCRPAVPGARLHHPVPIGGTQ